MSFEIPEGFYDFDEVVREARAKYTPEELAKEPELIERADEQLELAELVYNMRTGAGMTQQELAEKTGSSQPFISAVERGVTARACAADGAKPEDFTIPHELNALVKKTNLKILLDLQFKCVQETLLTLCPDPKFLGAKPGIISVLHTWGQKLTFHPHIHVCVSGGGITPAGQFVETKHKGFFLPKEAVASMFRGKYLCALKKLYEKGKLDLSHTREFEDPSRFQAFIDHLFRKHWLPFVKETFNGRGNAIRYLARYSFRTAIANSRIPEITDTHVTFRYKDYADGGKEKHLTVKGTDFIGMFLQHVLPKGFNRVRFSGYLTNCKKTKNLKLIRRLRNTVYPGNPYRGMKVAKLMMSLYGKDICTCPECSGRMVRLPRGMPASGLPSQLRINLSAMC